MAEKEEKIEVEGAVVESFRSGQHRVVLDNGHETLGYTSGRMRRYRIRINPATGQDPALAVRLGALLERH